MEIETKFLAILVATIASTVVGALWYSPLLFGKKWMRLVGMDPGVHPKGAGKAMGWSFVGTFIMAYVLSHLLQIADDSAFMGISAWGLPFWIWLGFIATTSANEYLFSPKRKPWTLYFLNNSHILVSLYVMAAVLIYWIL